MNEKVIEEKTLNQMWRQYVKTRDSYIKETLTKHYVPLVKLVAGRLGIYLNQYIDTDDLVGYGVLGLIDAIDKFDPDKNVKFETYASLRIRGSILDAVRKLDWIPRALRKKQKDISKVYIELESQLGRPPLEKEVASFLNISMEEYYTLLKEVNISSLVSIDENNFNIETIKDQDTLMPDEQAEKGELSELLATIIDELPDREKKVVFLYYYEEMTLKEISKILDVSESRISQLHTKAVSRLRTYMGRYHYQLTL